MKTTEILQQCLDRRVQGEKEYGSMTFLDYNCFNEAREELYDNINYLTFELIREDIKNKHEITKENYEERIKFHLLKAVEFKVMDSTEFQQRAYELIRKTIAMLKEVDLLAQLTDNLPSAS